MNENQIKQDLQGYGTIQILKFDAISFLLVMEGVSIQDYLSVMTYVSDNVTATYPNVVSFTYDSSTIKIMLVSQTQTTEQQSNAETEA